MAKVKTIESKRGEFFGGGAGVSTWSPHRDKKTGKSLIWPEQEQDQEPVSCEESLRRLLEDQHLAPTQGAGAQENQAAFECQLVKSGAYIETLAIKEIVSQPGLTELVITTQLLTAKNPQEKRVKARCCVERAQLVALAQTIDQYLKATESI